MSGSIGSTDELEGEIYQLYRRWALRKDPEADRNRVPRPKTFGIEKILDTYPLPPNPDKGLVRVVMGFMAVENLLPDYIRQILELVRESMGRMFFLALWGGEEALHSLALAMWLERVGAFKLEDTLGFYQRVIQTPWDPRRVDPDFDDPRHGVAYTTRQELSTSLAYRGLRQFAERCGQPALAQICQRLEAEEMGHHVFYRELSKLLLRHDRRGFAKIMARVDERFQMPGAYANLPDYGRWTAIAMGEGVVPDPRVTERSARIITPEDAVREQARGECWDRQVKGVRQMFEALNLPLPPSLARAPLVSAPPLVAAR